MKYMDKKNVLVIGDSFQSVGYTNLSTQILGKKLKEHGYDSLLLSASWCKDKHEMKRVDEVKLHEDYIKVYCVDPIQLRLLGEDVMLGIYSLGLKIIKTHNVKCIFFCEDMIYYPVLTMLSKKHPDISLYCIINASNYLEMYDDYLFPEAIDSFNDVDYVVSNSLYLKEIEEYAGAAPSKLLNEMQMYELMEKGEL